MCNLRQSNTKVPFEKKDNIHTPHRSVATTTAERTPIRHTSAEIDNNLRISRIQVSLPVYPRQRGAASRNLFAGPGIAPPFFGCFTALLLYCFAALLVYCPAVRIYSAVRAQWAMQLPTSRLRLQIGGVSIRWRRLTHRSSCMARLDACLLSGRCALNCNSVCSRGSVKCARTWRKPWMVRACWMHRSKVLCLIIGVVWCSYVVPSCAGSFVFEMWPFGYAGFNFRKEYCKLIFD